MLAVDSQEDSIMKTMAELPEIDFKSKEYLSSPLQTLAEYA